MEKASVPEMRDSVGICYKTRGYVDGIRERATLVDIYIKVDLSGWRNRPVQARNYSISLNRGDYMYLLVLFHLVSCLGMTAAGHRMCNSTSM